jgi:hypothetical protein
MIGAVVTAIALGLREVFEPRRDERAAYEAPAPSEPEFDEMTRVIVHLDPDEPRHSYALIRAPHRYDDGRW